MRYHADGMYWAEGICVKFTATFNDRQVEADVEEDMPLLWFIRDYLHLTGTKYGCGKALCGACTVHVDGAAIRSCVTPVSTVNGKRVSTIEQVAEQNPDVVEEWKSRNVAQCGYCQPGQIMSATALLARIPSPSDTDINRAMSGNICRCGTYNRIRAAIHDIAENRS